jgi:hypothetical protein
MEGIKKPSFPKERRRHKRFELSLALAYQCGMLKETLRTVDLSLGGVRIQTEAPIPVDERLGLIILFENQAIKPLGKVVRASPSSNQRYDIGICFETISQESVERLERFLNGIPQRGGTANREKALRESNQKGMESKPFELDRLRDNFLRWLHQSYPGDYQRYAHRPVIVESEIWDFLKNKGIDKVNIYYLMKSLKGG